MCTTLAHRGPDASGWHALPHRRGVFAHTRLAVIDPSPRAGQPFLSESGHVTLVFNGEIYNFRELRRRLVQRGARFRSESDTEVILHQYLEHGEAGLNDLDGMFAIGLFDAERDRLFLMRDRLGKKPLYLWRRPANGLAFASEIKAFAACPDFSPQLDPDRLPALLTYGYVPTPGSLYQDVEKVPPASRIVVDGSGTQRTTKFWWLEPPGRTTTVLREAKTLVRNKIRAAVRRRLEADVPVGAFLSGGIDSSIVVAEMAAANIGRIRTFCVGFEGDPAWDERPFARLVAERTGADHTELVVKASPEELLLHLLDHHDEPYGDSSALAVYAVSRATRAYVPVVLTGDGGDELFAGYTRFLGGLLDARIPAGVRRAAFAALRRIPEPRGYKHPIALCRRFLEHGRRSNDERLLAWNSFISGPLLGNILRPEVWQGDPWSLFEPQVDLLAESARAGADRLEQILRHNLATYLLDDLLTKTDRMTMAVGLEARSPFLDRELVEAVFRLPSRYKLRRGTLKWLLREAYRGVLPDPILDRKKHGFGVPVGSWWSGPLRAMVEDLLLDPRTALFDLLHPRPVRNLISEHTEGRRDHGHRIFLLVQLALWLNRCRARQAEPPAPPARPPARAAGLQT